MLKLKNIQKTYFVASGNVEALKGINLEFRKNEFVSVLGQSGCGKTTLLNIIGGLDKYTKGDLIINGRSTKEFGDRDWDKYRNHSIGFIFQSYNLIPHQTILGNVELALTIAGISKEERTKRAKEALVKVGLDGKFYSKPNQLSGGQCQRVAIARSLVNEPEILLADEPTGALDSETSVQIMELIKEIAKERLVIMVTHNPELAEQYSTRIIKLLDGNLISDSNPYKASEDKVYEVAEPKTKAKMSFWTAFKLSLQNLFSKKARTIMTSIAGSIGIIGVSAVLSVSNGVKSYVKDMQNDMLSGNPITITQQAFDISSMMSGMGNSEKKDIIKESGYVYVDKMIDQLVERSKNMDNMMVTNEINEDYIKYLETMPNNSYNSMVKFDYGLDVLNNIYTNYRTEGYKTIGDGKGESISLAAIKAIYTDLLNKAENGDYAKYSSMITSLSSIYKQAPRDTDYISEQYNVTGKMATEKDEIMIVLDKNSELSDLLLAQLGYYTQEEFVNFIYKAVESGSHKPTLDKDRFETSELLERKFTWYPNDAVFTKNTTANEEIAATYPFFYNYQSAGLSKTDSLELKIVGILEPKEGVAFGSLSSAFYYTEDFANYVMDINEDSEIIKTMNGKGITSAKFVKNGVTTYTGITYDYTYNFKDHSDKPITEKSVIGSMNQGAALLGMLEGMMGSDSEDDEETIVPYSLSPRQAGGVKLSNNISIYPRNFKDKDLVLKYLDEWNSKNDVVVDGTTIKADDRNTITYTDTLSIVIDMINDFINIITIALIAFTSLSLVVSCVMIGIITYVSVVERVKEIGVIRSLGGRKKDVSHLFNAETFIIGLASGVIGVIFTYIISFVINLIVKSAGIGSIAIFPIHYALIMITISILLTLISGFLPAKSAAKKDPVVALRTE